MRKHILHILLLIFSCVCIHAQKTVKLGSLQLTLANPPVCTYEDKGKLVENYWEIRNDSLYTIDIWYTNKKEVDEVILEAGALKDIVYSTCEIDTNKAEDSTCQFAIFIYDEAEGSGSSFCRRRYESEGVKERSWHGILLVFCNDYALFDKIKTRIMEGKRK